MTAPVPAAAPDALFALEATDYPDAQPEADTIALLEVLEQIAAERWRQDQRLGGITHADGYTPQDWSAFLLRQARAQFDLAPRIAPRIAPARYRDGLIAIAALAVAAAQAWDRRIAREEGAPR